MSEKKFLNVWFLLMLSIVFASCSSQQTLPTVTIEPTITLSLTQAPTSTPAPTNTPIPTETSLPTKTPTVTPTPTVTMISVVNDIFEGIEIIHYDDFVSAFSNYPPPNWEGADEKPRYSDDEGIELIGENVAFFEGETIDLGEGVTTRFKFTADSYFTIGFDLVKGRERIPFGESGFHSVSMEFRYTPSANIWYEWDRRQYWFDGDLKLQPDTWYMITLGITEDKVFVFRIWQPDNPDQFLTYQTKQAEMPEHYYFISWINDGATLYLDDFTIFRFSNLK